MSEFLYVKMSNHHNHRQWICCQCVEEGTTAIAPLVVTACPKCTHKRCSRCMSNGRSKQPPVPVSSQSPAKLAVSPQRERLEEEVVELPTRKKEKQTSSKSFGIQSTKDYAQPTMDSDLKKHSQTQDKPTAIVTPSVATVFRNEPDDKDDPSPLHLLDDPELLQRWHSSILRCISSKPDEFEGLNALHLARQGPTKEMSIPTIFASIDDAERESVLRPKLSSMLTAAEQLTLKLTFEVSAVRRTMDSQTRDPPPICKPANTSFQTHPDSGASIGIQNRVDSTATLGAYLSVDGRLFAVTVDHLIPDDIVTDEELHITHPSEQDKLGINRWTWLTQYSRLLRGYCSPCLDLIKEWCNSESMDTPAQLEPDGCTCPRVRPFNEIKKRVIRAFKPERLGAVHCRSGRRSRPSVAGDGDYMVEMDWLLFGINSWPEDLITAVAMRSESMSLSPVVPGAAVWSRGRTSGYQNGLINTAMSLVQHDGRFTQEWSVIQVPNMSLDNWISGGIGVDGDSGSWLFDYDDDSVYGMVWGRDQPWSNPISLFSPIEDMLTDIKELMGAEMICLPEYSSSATAIGKGKAKLEAQEGHATPSDILQSAPIKIDAKTREVVYEGSYTGGKSSKEES